MKIKHVLLTALFSALGVGAYAQDTEHNWFIQGQLGASYSLGDADFGKLVSPAGAISVGKYFNPTIGARLSISGWRGRGGNGEGRPAYGFYYGAATVDGLLNLSTLFAGKNPDRLFNASLIAGIGYNHRFEPNSGSFMGRLGLQGSIRLNDAFALNLEALANGVSDRWNKKDDHGFDSYYNVLVGITYKFGTGFNIGCPDCEPVYYPKTYSEKEVQALNDEINKLREQIANHKCPEPEPCPEVEVEQVSKPALKALVLFGLNQTNVSGDQMMNVEAIANYMKENPDSKVDISGYADKGTGTDQINERLAMERANSVADELANKYGISRDRMKVSSNGSTIQPFSKNDWNRVVIMIAEE
ncbi:OmpA family protein [Phocaeicola barnesiae]|uniref:OmpA family protein n=1 Tax=Phocaeicola barnesiae TaxID=376804 RepID=UPI00266EEE2D|nr:OmpA family protein [Phocaeicola barnesiae]